MNPPISDITPSKDVKKFVPSILPEIDINKYNCLGALFMLLLSSMSIRQDTVCTASREISENADAQDRFNDMNSSIVFAVLADGDTNQADIDRVQEENQEYAAMRQNIQGCLTTCKYTGQVIMTQASTDVNILQQYASETSGLLQFCNTVFQVIDDINQ